MGTVADSFLTDVNSSLLGTAKKALLILHKDDSNSGNALSSSSIASKTFAALRPAGGAAPSTLGGISKSLGSGFHVLQVQYNPSTISLQANSEEIAFQYLQQNVDSSIPNQNTRPPSVTLSVDLIFDAMNVRDCFMSEKFRLTTQDAAQLVAKGVLGGQSYSVQPQTNGLVGMVMRESTRMVTFQWADMSFTGEVTEIQAQFIMFSISGRPVRSTVHLNISQRVDGDSDKQYWKKAFDNCFGKEEVSALTGGKGAMESMGNLLNIAD